MPPSPSRRRSPSRETSHKRVNSFGNALPAKPKDDDLTLFADMQKTEIENFLLEPSEDFDESISKLSFFPDVKLGINVPARGESSHDLLKVDGDKNDYEWLLTPPETPLFRSLDDKEEQSAGHASRGRAQSKSMHISRSSTMDIAQRSSRSSASPSRLSLSPHSMPRTMSPNSTSRASPPLSLQPPTPSRRPSTPPAAKILAPPRRSPSPVSRKMSTGSSGLALNGARGASPVKTNHRSSPKPQGWQSNDPGLSYDTPPNLRTSLPDRPVSRSRGGSPTYFSGLDTGSRGRRQSMSPTPTRRASSSHSIERDRLSMYSKASATSSGEDDLDSIQSTSVGYSSCPAVKKSLAVMKTRTIASSKKPSKNFSPSSAPKRSFDSAVWLMDHRKAPQDRFRPLLSSVPATTFGASKINNVHKPLFSHNSSVTTSSNASSEHGATFGHHIDSDQEQQDLIGEWEADDGFRVHEDIFMFDKLDELNEETSYDKSAKYVNDSPLPVEHFKSDKKGFDMERNRSANQTAYNGINSSQVLRGEMATCSRCGKFFNATDLDEKGDCCEECASKLGGFSTDLMLWTSEEVCQHDDKIAKSGLCVESEPSIAPDSVDYNKQASLDHQTVNDEPLADCTEKCPSSQLMVDTDEDMLLGQEVLNHEANMMPYLVSDSLLENGDDISSSRSSVRDHQQTEPTSVEHGHYGDQMDNCNHGLPRCLNELDCQRNEAVSETTPGDNSHQLGITAHPSPKVESAEGTGISVLLHQKSSSNKWPVMEGRAMAATNIVCSEPYYTRDSINMMKRSFGRDSSSASSSIDLGSSRQSDGRFERLRSGKKGDFEKVQLSSTMSRQSIASMSDMSISGSSASLCHQSYAIEDTCARIDTLESSASRTVVSTEEDGSSKDPLSSAMECSSAARPIVNDDILVDVNSSSFDRSSETAEAISQNHSMGRMAGNDHSSTSMCYSDTEMPSDVRESSAAEESSLLKPEEDTSDATQCCLVGTPDPVENFDNLLMQSEAAVQASVEEHILDDCCVSAISEEDVLVSRTGTSIMELPNDEKSPETVEGSMKQIQRCFTLEEATDTILFCSSIVHDLAYKAATIALEHEQESQHADSTRPTVTIVGKSIPNEDGFLKLPYRQTPNRKVKRKRLEGEMTITVTAENEAIAKDPSPVRSASGFVRSSNNMKPPKLESKCNCVIM
ncbi:hypothetical protein ACQ4PT_071765 [Festuca glaucescens]